MHELSSELESLFSQYLSPLKASFFLGHGAYSNLTCLYSSHDQYKVGQEKSIYDLTTLMRTLSIRCKLVSDDLQEVLYEQLSEEICYILEWDDLINKIIIFNLEELSQFDEEGFTHILHTQQEVLQDFFIKFYHNYMGASGY